MKKIVPVALVVSEVAFPLIGFAQSFPRFSSVTEIVDRVICPIALWMFNILLVLAVIFVVWAAYLYLTSGGDSEKVTKATKTLTYTAVAVIVALVARAFPFVVASAFGADLRGAGC